MASRGWQSFMIFMWVLIEDFPLPTQLYDVFQLIHINFQPEEEQQRIVRETFQLVSKRDDNVCNFLESQSFLDKNSPDTKLIYRHYAWVSKIEYKGKRRKFIIISFDWISLAALSTLFSVLIAANLSSASWIWFKSLLRHLTSVSRTSVSLIWWDVFDKLEVRWSH